MNLEERKAEYPTPNDLREMADAVRGWTGVELRDHTFTAVWIESALRDHADLIDALEDAHCAVAEPFKGRSRTWAAAVLEWWRGEKAK